MRANLEDNRARRVRHTAALFATIDFKLTGAYRLLKDSPQFSYFDPQGVARDIFLPPIEPNGGQLFIIGNTGLTGNITIRDDGGTSLQLLAPGQSLRAVSSANGWHTAVDVSGGAGVPEAPNDGKIYGRQSLSWTDLGTTYQPLDADLTAIAGLTGVNVIYYRSGAGAWSPVTIGSGLTFTSGTLDAPIFTSTAKGEVPQSGGGSTNFLRADGAWALPPGGGGGTTLDIGTTPITGGTIGNFLYHATGNLLGEQTPTQVTASINVFTRTLKGLAPPSGGTTGTTNFLREDGSWAAPGGASRELITANRTYYTRKDGSDSNNGLADNAGGAFLTVQRMINAIAAIDRGVFSVTGQIRDGTYSENVTLKAGVGGTPILIIGNTTTPANVIIGTGSAAAVAANQLGDTVYNLDSFKVQGIGIGISCKGSTTLNASNVNFGITGGSAQAFASASGATLNLTNPTISGNSTTMFNVENFGSIQCNSTPVTFSGGNAFTYVCFSAVLCTISVAQVTWVNAGGVTGQRYFVQTNAIIYTGGGGPTYIPGSIDGTAIPFGVYI